MKKIILLVCMFAAWMVTYANAAEVVLLVDESGSMQPVKDDTVGGMRSFLADIKKKHPLVDVNISFFSIRVRDADIEQYHPNGNTALYDAIGEKLKDLESTTKPGEVVVFAILTDGKENSSQKYDKGDIFEKITHWEKWHGWKFLYLGANQDAFAEGASIGVSSNYNILLNTSDDVNASFGISADAVNNTLEILED